MFYKITTRLFWRSFRWGILLVGGPAFALEFGPETFILKGAYSRDGINWTINSVVAEQAVSPGAMFDGRKIRLYYGRPPADPFNAPESTMLVKMSADGVNWEPEKTVTIKNVPTGYMAQDPEVVRLDNGKYRMYYYEHPTSVVDGLMRSDSELFNIASGLSNDGITFVRESGFRFQHPKIMDPTIIRTPQSPNGWRIFFSYSPGSYSIGSYAPGTERRTLTAVSDDGLKFTYDGLVERLSPVSWVPNVTSVPYGFRLLYHPELTFDAPPMIFSAFSTDGKKWISEPGVRVFDPDGAASMASVSAGGLYWVFYSALSRAKMFPPETKSVLPIADAFIGNYRYAFAVFSKESGGDGKVYYNTVNYKELVAYWSGWKVVPCQTGYTDRSITVSVTGKKITLTGYSVPHAKTYSIDGTCSDNTCIWGAWY